MPMTLGCSAPSPPRARMARFAAAPLGGTLFGGGPPPPPPKAMAESKAAPEKSNRFSLFSKKKKAVQPAPSQVQRRESFLPRSAARMEIMDDAMDYDMED